MTKTTKTTKATKTTKTTKTGAKKFATAFSHPKEFSAAVAAVRAADEYYPNVNEVLAECGDGLTSAARYELARQVLRENTAVVMLKYYNTYTKTRTLKVIWYYGFIGSKSRIANGRVIAKARRLLSKLADTTKRGERCGDIYGFTK